MQSFSAQTGRRRRGFTLVELLVVIAIIGTLAAVSMIGIPKFLDKGKKVNALSQIRDVKLGFEAYESENSNRPLLPSDRREEGMDTVYGNKGGEFSNAIVIAVLSGKIDPPPSAVRDLDLKDFFRVEGKYMQFKTSDKKETGVGPDGVLYDPWGKVWMIAVNAFNGPNQELKDLNENTPGKNDRHLETAGLAVYGDSKPSDQPFVMWTYGKDGQKGDGDAGRGKKGNPNLKGSDDMASW